MNKIKIYIFYRSFFQWPILKQKILLCVDCVELMDSGGRVMNLEPMQHSVAPASSVLAARQHYVVLRVCRESVCSIHHAQL